MCGVKAGKFDRLFVCVKNPDKSATSPNEIVAMEAPGEAVMPQPPGQRNREATQPLIFTAK
jgi:hypothetical protein